MRISYPFLVGGRRELFDTVRVAPGSRGDEEEENRNLEHPHAGWKSKVPKVPSVDVDSPSPSLFLFSLRGMSQGSVRFGAWVTSSLTETSLIPRSD